MLLPNYRTCKYLPFILGAMFAVSIFKTNQVDFVQFCRRHFCVEVRFRFEDSSTPIFLWYLSQNYSEQYQHSQQAETAILEFDEMALLRGAFQNFFGQPIRLLPGVIPWRLSCRLFARIEEKTLIFESWGRGRHEIVKFINANMDYRQNHRNQIFIWNLKSPEFTIFRNWT